MRRGMFTPGAVCLIQTKVDPTNFFKSNNFRHSNPNELILIHSGSWDCTGYLTLILRG